MLQKMLRKFLLQKLFNYKTKSCEKCYKKCYENSCYKKCLITRHKVLQKMLRKMLRKFLLLKMFNYKTKSCEKCNNTHGEFPLSNLPPSPRTLFMACRCRDSCKYFCKKRTSDSNRRRKRKCYFWLLMIKDSWRPFHSCIIYIDEDWYWRSKGDFSSLAQVKILFQTFLKKKSLGFHVEVLVKTLPLMNGSITNTGLILTKLRWFQLFSTSKKKKQVKIRFRALKKIRIFAFSCCSTHKDLSIDVSITNVGLILTKLWWFLCSGYGQTDTRFWNPHMETCRHTKNFNSKLKIRS